MWYNTISFLIAKMSYIDEILKIIQDSKDVLVTTRVNASIDEQIAALIISNVIQRLSENKSVSYKFDMSQFSQIGFIGELVKNIGILKEDIPSNFVFEIQNSDNKIKNIEWKKEDGKINFYITTKNSKEISKNDLRFIRKNKEIDLVITIGVNKYDEIESLINSNSMLLEKTRIIGILKDSIESDIKGPKIIDNKASSYSEIVYEISQRFKVNLNKSEADMLLLGIYSATDNFRQIINPKSFSIASNLLALNADPIFANKYKELLENGSGNEISLSIETDPESVSKKKKSVVKKDNLSTKKSLNADNDKSNIEKIAKKNKTKKVKPHGIDLSTKGNQVNEAENDNLQIPLQKANAVPTVATDSNTQPNFITPPPINPVKQNSFNMPLNPKLR